MLGCKQQRQPKLFYNLVNLDQRIRTDNPLRKIHNIIDFSFVRPQVEHFYGERGNPSIDPIVLMKLMVILFLENIPYERELMRRLPERLDWLWFCEYDLDSELPDHSVLSKARRRWGAELFRTFFQNILFQCLKAGLVDGEVIHIDSSMIHANASVDSLKPAFSVLADTVYQKLEANSSELQGQSLDNIKAQTKLSTTDPDARCRVKGNQKVLGYQEHRCVDDANGIVTATMTTDAAVHEGETFGELIETHENNTQSEVSAIVADKAYGRAENYKKAKAKNIKPCIPHAKSRGCGKGKFSRDDFQYDCAKDCYICPNGKELRRQTCKPVNRNEHMYKAGRKDCHECPLRTSCYSGKYSKRIYRHEDQDIIDWADNCMSEARRRYLMGRRRAVVEGSFADAANNHGYKHSRWRSLEHVTIQNLLIASIQNLRKLIASSSQTGRKFAATINICLGNLMFNRVLQRFHQKITVWKQFRMGKMSLISLDINRAEILF
jgi:transposase